VPSAPAIGIHAFRNQAGQRQPTARLRLDDGEAVDRELDGVGRIEPWWEIGSEEVRGRSVEKGAGALSRRLVWMPVALAGRRRFGPEDRRSRQVCQRERCIDWDSMTLGVHDLAGPVGVLSALHRR
jgi:hypothetical protein